VTNLAIVERAWRGSVEEQYADILWLCRVLKRMRCEVTVLLRGNAVCYAVRKADPVTLTIGDTELPAVWQQDRSIADLLSDGLTVHVSEEDCSRLGIACAELLPGVKPANLAGIAKLCGAHDRIWYW
jgi:hypothetical protein